MKSFIYLHALGIGSEERNSREKKKEKE